MRAESHRYSTADDGHVIADFFLAAFWLTLSAARWVILIVLSFLEPFVRLMLSAVACLSVVAGLAFLGSNVPPPIPFWGTLCVALGCLALMSIYQGVLYILAR